jgi:hypothetical protein
MKCKKETQYSYQGYANVRLTAKCESLTTIIKGNLIEIKILIDNWGTYARRKFNR